MTTGLPALIARQVISIERPVMVRAHGVDQADWSQDPVETVTVPGCSVQPGSGADDRVGRDSISSDWKVWAPLGTSVGPFDRVTVPGYPGYLAITGQPEHWAPGLLQHTVLHLEAWKG